MQVADNMNIKDLTEYLSQYDSPYEPYTPKQMLPVIRKTLNALRNMPECRYVLKGSYSLSGYMNRESELFYVWDLYIFKGLLKESRYSDFVHELYDFLNYKILQDGNDNIEYLPDNIRTAIIDVIIGEANLK